MNFTFLSFVLVVLFSCCCCFSSVVNSQHRHSQHQHEHELEQQHYQHPQNHHHHEDTDPSQHISSCGHDAFVGKRLQWEEKHLFSKTNPRPIHHETKTSTRRNAQTQSVGPIRIVIRTDSLYDAKKYCTSSIGTCPSMLTPKDTRNCAADVVLTNTKRDILVKKLLPTAFARIQKVLSVQRLTSPIIVPTNVAALFTKPAQDSVSGVAGADMVLYVSAAPTDYSTVGWAASQQLSSNGRPVIGIANISPKFLKWYDGVADQHKNDRLVRAVMHELIHALGLSEYLFLKNNIQKMTLRTKPDISIITSPNVQKYYREFTGCPTVLGPALEDQGGAGSALSHLERRDLRDSISVGATGVLAMDKITLAIFEDSGVYFPNYQNAEPMMWGNNTGCDFIYEQCNTKSKFMGTATKANYWCSEKLTMSHAQCNMQLTAYGLCSITSFSTKISPQWFQNFNADLNNPYLGGSDSRYSMMDYCASIKAYSDAQCDNEHIKATTLSKQRGESFSWNSRCYQGQQLIESGMRPGVGSSETRCLLTRCPDGTRIQLKLPKSNWFDCPIISGNIGRSGWISASGYHGKIYCPDPQEVCKDETLHVSGDVSTNSPNQGTATNSPSSNPGVITTATTTTTSSPSKNQLPTALMLITAVPLPSQKIFNATFFAKKIQKLLNPISLSSIYCYRNDDYKLLVKFSSSSDLREMYVQRYFELDLRTQRSAGFINGTGISGAAADINGGGSGDNNNSDKPDFLAFLPDVFPMYIWYVIIIGGLFLIIFASCCLYFKLSKKGGGGKKNEISEHLHDQYREFNAEDLEELQTKLAPTSDSNLARDRSRNSPEQQERRSSPPPSPTPAAKKVVVAPASSPGTKTNVPMKTNVVTSKFGTPNNSNNNSNVSKPARSSGSISKKDI